MNFSSSLARQQWTRYSGQTTKNVTYIYVLNPSINRLFGQSNILYIGETKQSIKNRYKQQTQTKSSGKNTQGTNIRLTHVFGRLGLSNISCYFTTQMKQQIVSKNSFLKYLQIWNKRCYLRVFQMNPIVVSLERFLLVSYAKDHLELPPLNNRV